MATLLDLALPGGPLIKLDPRLEPGEQEVRVIYGSADHVEWVRSILPSLQADRSDVAPDAQLDDFWVRFCVGDVLFHGNQFKCLRLISNGVWELKTTDLRVFGWFPMKDHFVAVTATTKLQLVQQRTYQPQIADVLAYRGALPLDAPKFVQGDDPNDVVSNFSYT